MVASRSVGVSVVTTASIILDCYALDEHGERCLAEIGWSSGPLAGSLGSWVRSSSGIGTSDPGAHLYTHRCLWVVLATKSESITIVESTDEVTVDVPFGRFGSPVDDIGGECSNGVSDGVVNGSIIGGGCGSVSITFQNDFRSHRSRDCSSR